MSKHAYSDLEVAPGTAPQVVPGDRPEPVLYQITTTSKQPRKICGLRPKTFWIVSGVLIFLIIGAIAGGVAGGLLGRNNESSSSPNEENNVSTSSTSYLSSSSTFSSFSTPTTSTPTISTSTVVLPSATLLRDCPSSNWTAYSVPYDDGEPLTFRKVCSNSFHHVVNRVDVINEPTESLNSCIDACVSYNDKNKTAIATGDNLACNVVCWRNTDYRDSARQISGQCFGYTTQNESAGFAYDYEVFCDSAAWINQRFL
ncbi:hypothetical protein F4680DRAFT_447768 [Xylaria scruposa]|nr:hypothetical protein F4680DRAFT_447768 [Xylaria scruposa]